jgi:subtilisin family serine protease
MPNFVCRALILMLLSRSAAAQLRLPSLPTLPLQAPVQALQGATQSIASLSDARHLEIDRLLRVNRRVLESDPNGEPIVRGEILALSPSEAATDRARSMNFVIAREESIDSMNIRLVVLRAPDSLSTRKAIRALRDADPDGVYDYNHIYVGSGLASAAGSVLIAQDTLPDSRANAARNPSGMRVGLLDTGVDTGHPAFHESLLRTWGCNGQLVPAAHGTAVASLLIGRTQGFHGVAPDAELFAADVFCGRPTGGATDALIAGLGWLVSEQVPVINISLVGARDAMLEAAIARLTRAGFIIVAAVGNDGPAAAPLYPASYPNVVGVTGVDAQNRVLIEAARGPQVMFASPGADLAAASLGNGYAEVRGTSFAAPIVAGILAANLRSPSSTDAAAAIDVLAKSAIDLGSPGRDLTYGYGLVGSGYRLEIAALSHR